jgi:hypothetical protein
MIGAATELSEVPNLLMVPGQAVRLHAEAGELLRITCDSHTWMTADVGIFQCGTSRGSSRWIDFLRSYCSP